MMSPPSRSSRDLARPPRSLAAGAATSEVRLIAGAPPAPANGVAWKRAGCRA